MGYETANPQQASITSSNGGSDLSNQNGGGSGYGGLTAQDGVNPFQAAMNRDVDTEDSHKSPSKNDQWQSNDWGNTNSNDDWNDENWGSPVKEPSPRAAKQVSPRAAKQVSPRAAKVESKTKLTKKDSWGNDADEWENWLNDDSTSYKSTPSPRATKKGD